MGRAAQHNLSSFIPHAGIDNHQTSHFNKKLHFFYAFIIFPPTMFLSAGKEESKWEKDTSEMQKMFPSGRNTDLRSCGI